MTAILNGITIAQSDDTVIIEGNPGVPPVVLRSNEPGDTPAGTLRVLAVAGLKECRGARR